jgi:hypothetical protein
MTSADTYLDTSEAMKDDLDILELMVVEKVHQNTSTDNQYRKGAKSIWRGWCNIGRFHIYPTAGSNTTTDPLHQPIVTAYNQSITRSVSTTVTIEEVDIRMHLMSNELEYIKMLEKLNETHHNNQNQSMEICDNAGKKDKQGRHRTMRPLQTKLDS